MKIPSWLKRFEPIKKITLEECQMDKCIDNLPEEEREKIRQIRLLYKIQGMGSWF